MEAGFTRRSLLLHLLGLGTARRCMPTPCGIGRADVSSSLLGSQARVEASRDPQP